MCQVSQRRRPACSLPAWRLFSLLAVAFCGVGDGARAACPLEESRGIHAGIEDDSDWTGAPAPQRPVQFFGTVHFPDGRAAEGAVVVTSAGGMATVGAHGEFAIALELAEPIEALALTAVASDARGNWRAERRVEGLAALDFGDRAPCGEMLLSLAQGCEPDWLPGFGGMPGTEGIVQALAVFDDGFGPALYAGGVFETMGGAVARYAARWDGKSWKAIGEGVDFAVHALCVFDDGDGPALFAGGYGLGGSSGKTGSRIARWDGRSWSELGTGLDGEAVLSLCVFEDRLGPALYVGGRFYSAGVVWTRNIARWDGTSWGPVGQGLSGDSASAVRALCAFDDGSGPALYAGGTFTSSGIETLEHIARWDGVSWSELGQGVSGGSPFVSTGVYALCAAPEDAGPALYVGGNFEMAGGQAAGFLARWDSSGWSTLGQGLNGPVSALEVAQDVLYAGGTYYLAGGQSANGIARWDGSAWSPVGLGFGGDQFTLVWALCAFDDGSGPQLFAGGRFSTAGSAAVNSVAQWNGSEWGALGKGLSRQVRALCAFEDGVGPALYAGGSFTSAGGQSARRIARWSDGTWASLGQGLNDTASALCVFDDGTGAALYAGGSFTTAGALAANRIARWDGNAWSPLGIGPTNGTDQSVQALCVYDDGTGPALYAGGTFTAAGGLPANRIARWNGNAWSPVGAGIANGTNQAVQALCVFDDGSGPALYAGGTFTSAGGLAANRIARWDAKGWSPVGAGTTQGTNQGVHALCVFDDGTGAALYAGGSFTSAGDQLASRIARWDGIAWSALGNGIQGQVRGLAVANDGSGPALFAGGNFTSAGGRAASRIARWDGNTWSPLGSGVDDEVWALIASDGGAYPDLYVGGDFTAAPGGDSYITRWAACPAKGFHVLPGCFANPAALGSPSPELALGTTVVFDLQSAAAADGLALLYVGTNGADGAGCGHLSPGLGELLLAVVPQPIPLAVTAAPLGQAQFQLTAPNEPQLAGVDLTLQGAVLALSLPGLPLEFSNALGGTLAP